MTKFEYRVIDADQNSHTFEYVGAKLAKVGNQVIEKGETAEAEAQVRELISSSACEDMKEFLASGKDVRDYIGLSQDPLVHFFNKLKTRYQITKVLENFS